MGGPRLNKCLNPRNITGSGMRGFCISQWYLELPDGTILLSKALT